MSADDDYACSPAPHALGFDVRDLETLGAKRLALRRVAHARERGCDVAIGGLQRLVVLQIPRTDGAREMVNVIPEPRSHRSRHCGFSVDGSITTCLIRSRLHVYVTWTRPSAA